MNRRLACVLLSITLLPAACGGSGSRPPRNVLLISIDTLRADHCSAYGYSKPTTPFLEELAERGVLFENHMVNSNNTLTSHATIMTGLVPRAHDTYDKGEEGARQALAKSYRTVAEALRDAGFRTAAFTTHKTWLGPEFGVLQGFDVIDSAYRAAVPNWEAFLHWYDTEQPERMFAFLHFYDPHSEATNRNPTYPYDSTDELVAEFAGERPPDFTGCLKSSTEKVCHSQWLFAVSEGEEKLHEDHVRFLNGLYDAGVRKMDDDLRLFFEELERRGALDDTLVIITSDHGEDLYEHETLLHGTYYDAIMHVPLIVVLPERMSPARRVVAEGTRSIDIAPTILDFAGLPKIGQGQSLVPVILEGERVLQTEAFFMPAILRGWDERGPFKMFDLPQKPVFYDLATDPGETRNHFDDPELLAENEARIGRIRERIKQLRTDSFRVRDLIKKDPEDVDVTDEALQDLQDLGYIDSGEEEEE